MEITRTHMPSSHYPVWKHLPDTKKLCDRYYEILVDKYGSYSSQIILVGTGSSGAIIGSQVALKLGCEMMYVKKDGEESHFTTPFFQRGENKDLTGKKVVFIDDFIGTGTTMRKMYRKLAEQFGDTGEVIDTILVSEGYEIDRGKFSIPFPCNELICKLKS